MAEFVYETESGDRIQRTFPAGKAPRVVKSGGKLYRRSWAPDATPSIGAIRTQGTRGKGLHFKAWSQRPVPKGEDPRKYGFERVDTDGIGLVDGEREMRQYIKTQNELAAKGQADHEGIQWLGDDKEWNLNK